MNQYDEDEHISAVLAEIGYGSRIVCDVGARLKYSNSENLIRNHGFTGTLIDADQRACRELGLAFPTCSIICKAVMPEEINSVVPADTHVFLLDIDSYDWWVWANLIVRPALCVVETNPLSGMYVAPITTRRKDDGGYGMSAAAAIALGQLKGYDFIGTTPVNAFFTLKSLKCQYRLPTPTTHEGLPCLSNNNVFWRE